MTIRVVIADDHPLLLSGLAQVLSAEHDFEVVARAVDGDAALDAIHRLDPDLLILDLYMPRKDGIAVLREIRREGLTTKVVILTATESEDAFTALRLGVRGLVLKDMAPRLLVQCARVVHGGGTWIEKNVAGKAVDRLVQRETGTRSVAKTLTRREADVARMVAQGMPTKHVASELSITEGTAKLHLHHVYAKLNISGRIALMRYMQRNGLA